MKPLSVALVRRLPRYYRYLSDLCAAGVEKISSHDLAARMRVTASQVRQDFGAIGCPGQQGSGYAVRALTGQLTEILGLSAGHSLILIGVGNLGRALLKNFRFERRGFRLAGAFDLDGAPVCGQQVGDVLVQPLSALEAFVAAERPDVAALTLPRAAAPAMMDRLSALGVRGFWNFANMELSPAPGSGIAVENVHFSDSLMTLSYKLNRL